MADESKRVTRGWQVALLVGVGVAVVAFVAYGAVSARSVRLLDPNLLIAGLPPLLVLLLVYAMVALGRPSRETAPTGGEPFIARRQP
jgi:hypothetical protein